MKKLFFVVTILVMATFLVAATPLGGENNTTKSFPAVLLDPDLRGCTYTEAVHTFTCLVLSDNNSANVCSPTLSFETLRLGDSEKPGKYIEINRVCGLEGSNQCKCNYYIGEQE